MKGKIKLLHKIQEDDLCLEIYSYTGIGGPEVFTFSVYFKKSKGKNFVLAFSLRYSYITSCVIHGVKLLHQISSFLVSEETAVFGIYGHAGYEDYQLKYINDIINCRYLEALGADEFKFAGASGDVFGLHRPEELFSRYRRAEHALAQREGPGGNRHHKKDPVIKYWTSVAFELS